MKKILTLSIALVLVAGIVSMAKSANIDSGSGLGLATAYPKDRHIVKTSTAVVVLYNATGGIKAKKSTDNGATWTNLANGEGSTTIDSTADDTFSICLDGDNNIYVAYQESVDIYFKKLTYSVFGGTWTVPWDRECVEDANHDADEWANQPSITRQSNGDIWVSYGYENGDYAKVTSRYSTNDGVNWSAQKEVSSDVFGKSFRYWPALVIRNGNPFIVYADMEVTPNNFKWSYWTGTSWASTGTVTTDSPVSGDDFSIAMAGSDVHLVYNQSGAGIKHRYYNGSWQGPATLSSATNDKNVSLTTNDSDLWCFISQYVGVNSYNIKYKKWSGGSWDGTWTPITTDNANNLYSTTPLSPTEYIPLAWTEGTASYTVKFDSSVVIPSAKTYTWDGGGAAGSWTDKDNWDLNDGYPDDKNHKAVIDLATSEDINTGGARTLGELVLGGSYTGTLTLGGDLTLDSSGEYGGSLTIGSGTTLDLAGKNISGASSFTNNGTLKLQGDETTNISPVRGIGSTVEYTATSDSRPIKDWDYHHLKINGSGGTFTVGAGETLDGNLTIATGTFNLNGQTVNVSGNFLKSGGTLYMDSTCELDIAGNFTVTGGTATITVAGAKIYIGGNINISGDNSFSPSSGSYYMDGTGEVTISITGAGNDFGYDGNANFRIVKTNSTDKVTLVTDMAGCHLIHEKGIFDVNGNNASFTGVYWGLGNAKLQMSSGTLRCGKNEFNGTTYSPWYCEANWTENISGGTITVYGGKHATYGTAYFQNGSNFTPTGGTFQLVGTDDASIYIAELHDADFHFYNLTIGDGTNAKTVDMDASSYPLDVDGNLTVNTNATFNTSGKAVDVAGSVDINGIFNASSSTITVAGNWDSSSPGAFNRGTSTVDLTGSGNLKTTGGWLDTHFYNLSVSTTNKTTTLQSYVAIQNTLTIGSGELTDGTFSYYVILKKNSDAPLSLDSGATITVSRIVYRPGGGTVTVTGGNYGTLDYLELYPSGSGATFNLGGDVTLPTGTFWLVADNTVSGVVCNTQNYDITASTGLRFGYNTAYGTTTLNCGTSTIDIGTDGLYVYTNGGSHTLNLSSATITCAGKWDLLEGSGSITQDPGTSTVILDGSSATPQAVTSNGQSFYNLKINNTNAGVQLQDAADLDGGLIVTTGTLGLNNYNITISSDVSISGSGSLTCSSGEQITVGRNWSASSGATFTAASSTTTFNGNGSFDILSSGTTFYNLAFSNSVSTWTLTDDLFCTNISLFNGFLTDSGQIVTVSGNINIPDVGSRTLYATGLWIQSANGNIYNPYWWTNAFSKLKIADGVTSIRTGAVLTRKLILGTNAKLQGSSSVGLVFPTVNDFIDMGSGSDVIEGEISITPYWDQVPKTQKAISVSAPVSIGWASTATIKMTGNWTTGNLTIHGGGGVDTEGEAVVLDTNGNNLTVIGNLTLGYSSSGHYGKILLSSGTHSVTGNVGVGTSGATHGYFYLDSADISIGGNCDFSRATVTPGTSTVTLNGSSGIQNVTSDSESFYHLVINSTGTSVQLQDAADIDGGLIISTGTLDLNSYNITISSDVYIDGTGSLTCSSGEQITVGRNWSASSGATFTAANSTTTFNGSGSFNILSSGTTFYNLAFNNSVSTWTLTDALYSAGDFTLTSAGNVDTSSNVVTIAGDFTVNGGKFTAGASTITVAGNWDTSVSADAFNYGTSTVDLTGTGNLKTTGGWSSHFYNLSVSATNKTTTLLSQVVVADTLTIGSGELTDGSFSYFVVLRKDSGTPLDLDSGATIKVSRIVYRPQSGTVIVTGGNYQNLDYLQLQPVLSNATFNLGGDVKVNGIFYLCADNTVSGVVCDTKDYELTATGLRFGYSAAYGTTTLNCGISTIDIGTGGVYVANNGGSHTLNLSSATVTCEGDWQLVDGTGSIDQNWGTSTVAFDGLGTSTSTLTGSTTFYVFISTTTGKNIEVTSDNEINVTNHLNFENITLHSTSGGATWYLNLSGTQDVSGVDVRDSNASGSADTIIAFASTDSGNNTNWDFGPPEAITDLSGQYDGDTGDVTLYWSTPGDDYNWQNTLVDGSEYIIDYSTYVIAWSTKTYDVEIPTHSVAPHTPVCRTITGLTGGTSYYFRIWTADEIPLWSDLSNGCTVWVTPILSVSISTDTYNFGELNASTAAVSTANITVTNDGNVKETYSIKCSSSTKWTPNNSPGNDKFTLQAAFHQSEPNNDDIDWKSDDILTESLQPCTTAAFSINNSQNGKNVPPFTSNIRDFWLRIKTPLSTSTSNQQTITVTISAE